MLSYIVIVVLRLRQVIPCAHDVFEANYPQDIGRRSYRLWLFSLSAMVEQYERLYAECMDKRVTSRENCADGCSVVEKEKKREKPESS